MVKFLVYFFKLWDFLTHETYRVKIKKYSDGSQWCFPQRKYRMIPWWFYIIFDHVYGTPYRFRLEGMAWDVIAAERKYKPRRLVGVEVVNNLE